MLQLAASTIRFCLFHRAKRPQPCPVAFISKFNLLMSPTVCTECLFLGVFCPDSNQNTGTVINLTLKKKSATKFQFFLHWGSYLCCSKYFISPYKARTDHFYLKWGWLFQYDIFPHSIEQWRQIYWQWGWVRIQCREDKTSVILDSVAPPKPSTNP